MYIYIYRYIVIIIHTYTIDAHRYALLGMLLQICITSADPRLLRFAQEVDMAWRRVIQSSGDNHGKTMGKPIGKTIGKPIENWENHRKTRGKLYENYRKMMVSW